MLFRSGTTEHASGDEPHGKSDEDRHHEGGKGDRNNQGSVATHPSNLGVPAGTRNSRAWDCREGGGTRDRGVLQTMDVWAELGYMDRAVDRPSRMNSREKASFLKENILPIADSGQLKMINPADASPIPSLDIFYCSGHTEKMMIPMIRYGEHTICFMADLLPSVGHIPLPYVMGYDTRPLLTLEEKGVFLERAARENFILFFEHDPVNECCTVQMTDTGVRLDRTFPLHEITG